MARGCQIIDVPQAEFSKRKKVFARHKYPNALGFSHEMKKTKGRVVRVAKEFKARQKLRFD